MTNAYWEKFAKDQEMDNISMHRGVEDSLSGSREGSKQGSILSRLSAKIKKQTQTQTQDHTSLLEQGQGSDSEEESVLNVRL